MKSKILLFAFLALIVSCNSHEFEASSTSSSSAYGAYDMEESGASEDQFEPEPRKLITEGDITFEVNNVDSTKVKIEKLVSQLKGYVTSDNSYESEHRITHSLAVRIPSEELSRFITLATEGEGKIESKSIHSQDVTDRYADLERRISNKKALEERFLALLDKASKINELIELERELARLRSEIEQMEGQVIQMDNKISFSTLNLHFYEKVKDQPKYAKKFNKSLKNGWSNLLSFIIGVVSFWPFVIIAFGLLLVVRYWRSRKRKV